MRSGTQCRIGIARSVLAALLPIALSVPAFAQPVPGVPSGNPGNSYYPASPGRNAVGSAYGDSGAEAPWQRRSPPYENRRGGPRYGAGPNWLPGAAGVLGVLPMIGGGTSWPSWEQVPARPEGSPSAPGYQAYPGSATPPSQPNRPRSDAGPSGANWQPQPAPEPEPEPEPSGEPVVTAPNNSASSSARTSHPPSSHLPSGKIAARSHPTMYPPRKPPVPPPQQIEPPSNPQPAAPVAAAVAMITDTPPAVPSAAAPPPPEPSAPANTNPATPPNPPASAPTQDAAAQSPATPLQPMLQIGLPLSALVALAVLVVPLRLLTRAWRRRSQRRTARVLLLGDPAASRMISEQSGTEYPAIALRLRTKPPVATPRWTAA
jgi:hypothetical protein